MAAVGSNNSDKDAPIEQSGTELWVPVAAQSNLQVRTGKETVIKDHTVLEQRRRKSMKDNCRYSPDSKLVHIDVKSKVLPLGSSA
jgi:hypothetical protein